MVAIWVCPSLSITVLRSAPLASSHEAWACLRSCIRTVVGSTAARTAGRQTLVRKVFRDVGCCRFRGVEGTADGRPGACGGGPVDDKPGQVGADLDSASVIVRVGLDGVALPGGGVLLADLHDRLLHRQQVRCGVEVLGSQGRELTPAHPGLDPDQQQHPVPRWDRCQQLLELDRLMVSLVVVTTFGRHNLHLASEAAHIARDA